MAVFVGHPEFDFSPSSVNIPIAMSGLTGNNVCHQVLIFIQQLKFTMGVGGKG